MSSEPERTLTVSRAAGARRRTSRWLRERAKQLRLHPTPAEDRLWQKLRMRQLGAKFRRQHCVGNYIADFYCHAARLVIEVDGGYHRETRAYDDARDAWITAHHLEVLRFTNAEVEQRLDRVLTHIIQALQRRIPDNPK